MSLLDPPPTYTIKWNEPIKWGKIRDHLTDFDEQWQERMKKHDEIIRNITIEDLERMLEYINTHPEYNYKVTIGLKEWHPAIAKFWITRILKLKNKL